ncbi:copper resistance protein CopC [Peribacillus deserti]|uniref:Copper resistance protein CopC n=1 Tax=Peribacillus deserti TaxID=673318 RepID=A0A2N5M9V6_9BACI|nr:copper resistance protein CopC [Peribacillus deserti]PLT31148.1 copper resistance protein CopC [Peribacillus deserti]
MKKKSYAVLLLIAVLLLTCPSFSFAHAYIKKSVPSENETLVNSPPKVSIQFNETIQSAFTSIEVYDAGGKRVDKKNGQVNAKIPSIIEASLKPNLPEGVYSTHWRAVSSDGHPVQGVIPFQIGAKSSQPVLSSKESAGYTPHWDLIVIRWIHYVSNACIVGVLFFNQFLLPKEPRKHIALEKNFSSVLRVSLIFLVISVILSFPLQATIESDQSWLEVFNVATLTELLTNTSFGQIWMVQIVLLVFLGFACFGVTGNQFNKRLFVWASFAISVALLLTKSFTSHAATSENNILPVSMDFLHLFAASIWIGSLTAMVSLFAKSRKSTSQEQDGEIIQRFSAWGIGTVVVLTLTGLYGSFLHIPNLDSLFNTGYGRVLCGKVILFMIMLLFATNNFLSGRQNRQKGLKPSIWAELKTGLIVLALSVILTNMLTPVAKPPGDFQETKTLESGNRISFQITPNRTGENVFEVTLSDPNGETIKNIEQATLKFESLDMEMAEQTVTLNKMADGKYAYKGMDLNMEGKWTLTVHVLTKNLETMDAEFITKVVSP